MELNDIIKEENLVLKKSRLLNVIEDEVRELFRTGEAFGLVRNNGREDF